MVSDYILGNVFNFQSDAFIVSMSCNYCKSVFTWFYSTVKRRSHGCDVTPTKMSPVLDTEANFEVCFAIGYILTAT